MIHAVVSKARPGSIIIFHINGRGWKTAEALPTILRRLRERGFRFVRLSGLIASREIEPKTTEPGATLRLRELLRRGAEVLHRFVVSD